MRLGLFEVRPPVRVRDPGRTKYVRVQCWGTDQEDGEDRMWNYVVAEEDAAELAAECMRRWPDVRAEIVPR